MQAAINAASNLLPRTLPAPPDLQQEQPRRHADPDAQRVSSDTLPLDAGRRLRRLDPGAEDLAGAPASAWSRSTAARSPRCACRSIPAALAGTGLTLEDVRAGARRRQRQPAQGQHRRPAPGLHASPPTISSTTPTAFRPLVIAYKNGAPVRLRDVADVVDGVENAQLAGWADEQARHHPQRAAPARRQRHRRSPTA